MKEHFTLYDFSDTNLEDLRFIDGFLKVIKTRLLVPAYFSHIDKRTKLSA